jgi:hypothetical protein
MEQDVHGRPPGAVRFIRPTHIEGQRMHGPAWSLAMGAEVLVSAWLPKNLDADRALEAARNGELVLLGNDRLGWARGQFSGVTHARACARGNAKEC